MYRTMYDIQCGIGRAARHAAARALTFIAAAALAVGCADTVVAPHDGKAPGFPARMLIAAGDAQSAVVGEELDTPITVRVVDETGRPIAGQVVNFRVVAGGGSVFAGAAVTDAQGRAAERWTLGPASADSQRVEARAVNPSTGAGIVFATFHATARAGTAASLTRQSADQQSAAAGAAVAAAPAVRVADQNGNPVAGVSVQFAIGAGRGTVEQPVATTDASGIATAKTWTLGTTPGVNTVVASVGQLAPVMFTATGTRADVPSRKWTVMVYMAADNSLAVQGVGDIDEMEAAGNSADVQVVVQGEFNQAEFARAGCGQASCAHLPNFNTFRYAVGGNAPSVTGPNGAVTDIGNRNMTDPAQLREFIQWAKTTYPAERYAVILWNHGGGYAGLLEDLGSSGSKLMSIGDLPAALTGVGPIDVLDFDMCLMGGYETLAEVSPFAKYVVFSEETEPGEGDPYTGMIRQLRASPNSDGRAVAAMFVDEWAKFYAGHRASTTKSAYDMGGFAAFETALGNVAQRLKADAGSAAIRAAARSSQRYELPALTDIGNFIDSLQAQVGNSDAALRTALGTLRTSLFSQSFRVANTARTGSAGSANNVARSTGLNVLLPSGTAADALPNAGPQSFAEYQRLLPDKPWTAFLAAYLRNGTTTTAYDQGEQRFESYVVWDSASTAAGVDIDMWLLEPDGNLYIPFLGTVTPNGHLTPDSDDNKVSYEGLLTNRFVAKGRYTIYVNLYTDPRDKRPRYDVQYRFGQTAEFRSLYSPRFPTLSMDRSWLDDATPSLEEADGEAYTDLQQAAYADIGVPSAQLLAKGTLNGPSAVRAGTEAPTSAAAPNAATARITARQLETVRRNWSARRGRRDAAGAAARLPGHAPAAPAGLLPLRGR